MQTQQEHAFEFTGKGWEYFRIWIVNLLLTILTLGVYSAWAKVRRLQYFYRNTRLDGASFEYHGTPIAILKGRVNASLAATTGVVTVDGHDVLDGQARVITIDGGDVTEEYVRGAEMGLALAQQTFTNRV